MENLTYYSESIETNNGNPAGISYFVGCIMVAVFILGLLENSTVIFAYIKTPKLRTVNNAFLIGLSLSDTGQTVFNIPLVIVSCFSRKWIFGHPVCLYIGFVTAFFGLTQITLLCIIALDRYFIIVHQSRVLSATGARAFVTILCCFVYGGCWALGPLVGWSEYVLVAGGMSCSINWSIPNDVHLSYTVSLFVCVWFLPLSVIIFCYIRIARIVFRERKKRSTLRSSLKRKKTTKEKHVAITVLIMICAFVVSWTPYSIVALMSVFRNIDHVPSEVYLAPAVFAKASIIWNPMIYIARHREFRHACRQILSRIFMCDSGVDITANKNEQALEQKNTDNHNNSDNQYSLPLLQSTDILIIPVNEIEKCTCDQTNEYRRERTPSNHTTIQEDTSVSSESDVLMIPCSALQGLSSHTLETTNDDQSDMKLENTSYKPLSQCYKSLSTSKENMHFQHFYTERTECVSDSDKKLTLGSKYHLKSNEENILFNDTHNCYQIVKVKCICNQNCTNTKFGETCFLDYELSGYILLKQLRRQRRRHFKVKGV